MKKNFYITTAIPYVNAAPHLGFALEIVQADTINRWQKLLGQNTYFLTGSDENSLKNVQAAEKQKIPVKKLVDQNAAKFKALKEALNLSFDDFIRTTEKRHFKTSQAFWQACNPKDIYQKKYQGLYCVGCEAFYTAKDLINGKCPEHQTKPELVSEKNYFFRLSHYQAWLEGLISTDKLKIIPQTKKNEVLAFIRRGLQDFSISRSVKRAKNWGIPVPDNPSQIIYVWFDALINYISALNWPQKKALFEKNWPADVHVIGKGITRFHAIYWPAMLKSAGLAIPKQIFVHGYITINGQKLSKSLGNVIDPFKLTKKYGTDPIRYYLLREIPAHSDGDFSEKRFVELYNADLANGLGNLVSRVAKLCENSGFDFAASQPKFCQRYQKYLDQYRFDLALKRVWQWVSQADKKINQEKVWELKDKALEKSLVSLVKTIRRISYHLQPFLPETSVKITQQFKGPKISAQKPLFPRL